MEGSTGHATPSRFAGLAACVWLTVVLAAPAAAVEPPPSEAAPAHPDEPAPLERDVEPQPDGGDIEPERKRRKPKPVKRTIRRADRPEPEPQPEPPRPGGPEPSAPEPAVSPRPETTPAVPPSPTPPAEGRPAERVGPDVVPPAGPSLPEPAVDPTADPGPGVQPAPPVPAPADGPGPPSDSPPSPADPEATRPTDRAPRTVPLAPDGPKYDETGINDGEAGPDALWRRKHGRIRRELPPEGEADRPTRPRVGVDLMYPGDGIVGQGGAALSVGRVGEDVFLHFVLSTVIAGEQWAVAPRLPIRFRIEDNAPKTKWILREEDWDEVSDFARLLAFFQWGHAEDPFYLRIGELPGISVGHGTLVNRYYNTIDIDHYQGGLYSHLDLDIAGGEALLDNLFDPEVAVARGFMRPLHLVDAELPYFARNLKIGVTLGADFRAPLRVATHPMTGEILTDTNFNAKVVDRAIVALIGGDLEIPVWSSPHFDFVPYLDVNSVDADSVGVHVGAFFNVRFDTLTEWRSRLEYRYSGAGYDPDYVNPFYEVHRVRYRNDQTKLDWLRTGWDGGRHGVYGETELRLIGTMRLTMAFARDDGPPGEPADTDLAVRVRFPQIGPIGLTFFLARMDFDGVDDFLDPTNTVFAVSARYNVLDLFYVQARVINEWWLQHSTTGASAFETTTDFDVGIGLLLNI